MSDGNDRAIVSPLEVETAQTAAGSFANARPDNPTMVDAVYPRSALRMSTISMPLSTSAFQSEVE